MFGMCMKGKKKHACCCMPLNVAGLSISVILIVLNAATFIDQLRNLLRTEHKETTQIISLIFCALPLLCAILSIVGILLRKASLVGLAVTCIMPSILLVIVALITLWIGICQDESVDNKYQFLDWVQVNGQNGKYVRGGIISGLALIVIALLCYVGNIYKSIATMIAKGENPWVIHQSTKKHGRPISADTSSSV